MKNFWISLVLSQIVFIVFWPVWFKLLSYLHPVVLPVIWVCITMFVFFVVYYFGKGTIQLPAYFIKIVMVIYGIGLLILLFFRPANQEYNQINLIPFRTINDYLVGSGNGLVAFYNLAANILLFVPYGAVALMISGNLSRKKLFFIPAAVILLIETLQYLTRRGSADVDDLLLNLLGVGFGYLLSPMIKKVVKVF